jgi:hypothetical protein
MIFYNQFRGVIGLSSTNLVLYDTDDMAAKSGRGDDLPIIF